MPDDLITELQQRYVRLTGTAADGDHALALAAVIREAYAAGVATHPTQFRAYAKLVDASGDEIFWATTIGPYSFTHDVPAGTVKLILAGELQ